MILCLDVGNSQIHGGIFVGDELQFQFRHHTDKLASSDELGLFLRSVLRENDMNPDEVKHISICTVVPEMSHSLKNCCLKYFHRQPFLLQAGAKTGLKVGYKNPLEVGSDRIANAIAASHLFPEQNLILIDFGTATTFCAISKTREYLGGVILAGMRISMESLESRTSKLPSVEIVVPEKTLGKTTVDSIQSGLFFGNYGAVKEISNRISKEAFGDDAATAKVVTTGGLASLFKRAEEQNIIDKEIFHTEVPDLALKGLYLALKMNT